MNDRMTKIKDNIYLDERGKAGSGTASIEEQQTSLALEEPNHLANQLMERITNRDNLNRAYKRVKANKGAAGVDGMVINELPLYIRTHGVVIIESLLNGSYQPQATRGVQIPKPAGGKRQLGIPTVLDRVIQQAILQVIEPLFDSKFSESSFGFRPKRSAHQAVKRARAYVEEGYCFVADVDLEKYFDRVNHDILMSRLARRIDDRRLLKIIRGFLEAGLMQNGMCIRRDAGTPQGGPLSPLLSNILLDELDKELERRGHRFCRYADDCNIYVQTKRAGIRVMNSIKEFLEKRLKLKINEAKSAVALVGERKFLGYRLQVNGRLSLAPETLKRVKDKIRKLTKRNRGVSLGQVIKEVTSYLQGWLNYFQLMESRSVLEKLDSWLRRRLRCYRLKQRKRSYPIMTFLRDLGISEQNAWKLAMSSKGWWTLSLTPAMHMAMPSEWFESAGLINLAKRHDLLNSQLKPPYATSHVLVV